MEDKPEDKYCVYCGIYDQGLAWCHCPEAKRTHCDKRGDNCDFAVLAVSKNKLKIREKLLLPSGTVRNNP